MPDSIHKKGGRKREPPSSHD